MRQLQIMADIHVQQGALSLDELFNEGDFLLRKPATNGMGALFEYIQQPNIQQLSDFGHMWNGMDGYWDTDKIIEQIGDDATMFIRRVVNGWHRRYGASENFSLGETIIVTHNSDPDSIRFCRAWVTYPPSSQVTAQHESEDPTGTCYDYWPTGRIEMRGNATVNIVDTMQLPVSVEHHAEYMQCDDAWICKDRYQSDRFIVQSQLEEGGLYTYFYFKFVDGHWEYTNHFTSSYSSRPAGYYDRGMMAMNSELFVIINGNWLIVYKCLSDVWSFYKTIQLSGSVLMAGMYSTAFTGVPVNFLTVWRNSVSDVGYEDYRRVVAQIDLDSEVEEITQAHSHGWFTYPESGPEYQLSTISHGSLDGGKMYTMIQHLEYDGILSAAAETASLLELNPDTASIQSIYTGPYYASVFSDNKTETVWYGAHQRDSEHMFLRNRTTVYEASCQGPLMIAERYYNLVLPYHDVEGLDPDNPFIYGYAGQARQLFFGGDELRTIVGTESRYLDTIDYGVTYEGALDDTSQAYTRIDGDQWYTNSTDGSGKVFIATPNKTGYLVDSPAYCIKRFYSEYAVVSVTAINGTSSVPAGTTMKYAFSSNGTDFYYWNSSAWVICSALSDGNTFADLQTILSSNPFMAGSVNDVHLRVYMETTDDEVTPSITNLSLTMSTISAGMAIMADSNMVKITHLSATQTQFESMINEVVLCEAQVSMVGPKYNDMYED